MPETKAEKFQRIRDQRLPKIIHALGLLENLGTTAYESTPDERLAILTELYAKVDELSEKFEVPVREYLEPREEKREEPQYVPGTVFTAVEPSENINGRVGATAPPWASVVDMAREAKLVDLSGAMCIYMDRMSDVLRK